MHRRSLVIAACVLAALVTTGVWLYAQQSKPQGPTATDFSGKVLFVESGNGLSIPLEKARIQEAGGRTFVVGQVPHDFQIGHRYTGSTLWIPLSDVVRMSEFATFGDYATAQRAVKEQ